MEDERKTKKQLLQESEARYRQLAMTAHDAIITMDFEGIITYANPAAQNLAGGLDIVGMSIKKFIPPELISRHIEMTEARRQGYSETLSYEWPLLSTKDGSIAFFDTKSSLLMEKSKPSGVLLIARDITERKRVEQSMRESEQQFSAAFNTNPIPTAISTIQDGRFLNVNEAFLRFFSFSSKTEVIGKTSLELGLFANPHDRQSARKDVEETGRVHNRELKMVTKDGRRLDMLFSAEHVLVSNKQCLLTTALDITECKVAENALKQSREQYRMLVENINDVIFTSDLQGKFSFVSPAIERISGYTSGEVEGRHFSDFVHPDDMNWLAKALAQRVHPSHSTEHEFRVLDKTGEVRWVVTKTRLVAESGKPPFITGIMTDITARKLAEEEKEALKERLQRAEKMEALGLLAGGVAHDLNNVLGIVVGYAEMVLSDIDEKSPLRDDLLSIMDGGQRAAAIVQDLLTLARRGVVGRKVLNANRLILDFNRSPEWEKFHAYHPSVQLKTDLETDLLNISASPVHLQKTLFNLVSNASEAMPKGGLLTIKTSNKYLDKPISGYDNIREGDYVVLSVSDEGEGISESDLKRIFEPFYTKKIMGRSGTGLGLAVVWGTVKDHQGYIDVQSEEGKGTVFALYFPVTREDITRESSSVSLSEYLGNGESILVVDDVKGQRDLASAMLKKLNYKVANVASGEDALQYVKQNKVGLLVLDMIMEPGMDGLETYEKIIEIHPGQKAILVSGFSESDRVQGAQALGAGAYVKKPYVIEKLGMAVKNELDRSV